MTNTQNTNKHQLPPAPEAANPFKELYSMIYRPSLEALESERPERAQEQSEAVYDQSENVQRWSRRYSRLYKNLISINRLASQPQNVRDAAAAVIFRHLPVNSEAVLASLQNGCDLSSAQRFRVSMGLAPSRGYDDSLWHFGDLNTSNTSGFSQFCNNSLPALSLQEQKLSNDVADHRVESTLDAICKIASKPSSLGLPPGLTASEQAIVTRDLEARNIRLAKTMDRVKAEVKAGRFCADLVPTNRGIGNQYKDAFQTAGKALWQAFSRDSGSPLFGRVVLLAIITRSLEALAAAMSTEQGFIALETHTPELVRAFAKPSTAQSAMNVILAGAGSLDKVEQKLNALEHALASTAWGGNHSVAMSYALEVLQAGALAQLSDRSNETQSLRSLTESIASGVYADMRETLLDLD